ncbi:GntR family transcriptional regulator [Sulfitobacter sp. M368]|jgi:GntR family transcriptional regulator, carbon starvation induced regulator|uniref:GntR family transcriptional regulator n=1 Tax=Sulfitobacter sp. M368 TaxID=2867021 RepID=UPI0021A34230|nr:GntR family transcriptional regulator [Sulfitobacter sp. M368]UWR16341.1 GntR family transcriptional regulator [Sulfitobacter sp. M368]
MTAFPVLGDPFNSPGVRETTATAVYRRMKVDLMTGALKPGARLNVSALANRYETSNNPVREALNRLTAERLIVQRDQKGFAAPLMTVEDLRDLADTRIALETIALRRAMERGDDSWRRDCKVAFHVLSETHYADAQGLPDLEWEAAHRSFHLKLIEPCGSPRLLNFCDDLMYQAARARFLAVTSTPDGRLRETEHSALLEAVIGGDQGAAIDRLSAHYRTTIELVEKRLDV